MPPSLLLVHWLHFPCLMPKTHLLMSLDATDRALREEMK